MKYHLDLSTFLGLPFPSCRNIAILQPAIEKEFIAKVYGLLGTMLGATFIIVYYFFLCLGRLSPCKNSNRMKPTFFLLSFERCMDFAEAEPIRLKVNRLLEQLPTVSKI